MVKSNVTAKFPTTLLDPTDVGVFTNEEATNLTADALIGDTTVNVNDASAFELDMWLYAMARDGILLMQVTAVDAAQDVITVSRPKDGMVDVDLHEGVRILSAVPAIALNQMRVDLIAVETALGAGNFVAANADRVLFLNASGNITTDADFKYVSDQLRLAGQGSTTGLLLGGDAQWYRGAANRMDLASGDDLNIVLGAIMIAGVTVFESDRDFAINLIPNGDDTLDLGSATRRWRDIYLGPGSLRVVNASGDANSIVQVDETGFRAGAGAASVLDVLLARQAASMWQVTGSFAGSVRLGMSGAGTAGVEIRASAADAQPSAQLGGNAVVLGPGVATAPDAGITRGAADRLDTIAGDSFNVGSGGALLMGAVTVFESDRDFAIDLLPNADNTVDIGSAARRLAEAHSVAFFVEAAASDANPVLKASTSGLETGAGAASALDLALARQASSLWRVTGALAGDVRVGLLGAADPVVSGRLATADANPAFGLTKAGLAFGAGGVSATDVLLARQASSLFEVTGALAGSVRLGMSGAGSPIVDVRTAAADAEPTTRVGGNTVIMGLGGATAPDAGITRGAANRLDTLAGDSFNVGSGGAFLIDTVTVFESDRDLAVSLIPNADDTLDLGSASRRWQDIYLGPGSLKVLSLAGDANSIVQVDNTGFRAGAGGASALDVLLARQAASMYEVTGSLAGSVRFGMIGPGDPRIDIRTAAADAEPSARMSGNTLILGPGVATAPDAGITRGAADRLDTIAGDSFNVGSGGAFLMDTVTVFESDRDLAITLLPNADNTLALGSTTRNYANLYLKRTSGSVLFMGANGLVTEDNTALAWNNTNKSLVLTGGEVIVSTVTATKEQLVVIGSGTNDAIVRFSTASNARILYLDESASNALKLRGSGNTDLFSWGNTGDYDIISGVLQLGSVTLFENDRDLAVDLLPNADDSLDLGSSTRRFVNLHLAGGMQVGVRSISTTPTTLTLDDYFATVDSSGGVRTTNLPATPLTGEIHVIKRNGANTVTVDGNGKTIDGAATRDLTIDDEWVTVIYNGTAWEEIG